MLFSKSSVNDVLQVSEASEKLICEAMLVDNLSNAELEELCESSEVCKELTELGIVTEKTIVRLDKKAKLSRAFRTAVFTVAREHKDPKFKKLVTVWKAERALEAYLVKKYKAEALKRAKLSMAKASVAKKDTKSGVVAKAVAGAKKKFN